MSYKTFNVLLVVINTFISLSLLSRAAMNYFGKKKENDREETNEVIMFSYEDCTQLKKSKYSRCFISNSMERVLYYLSTPRHSLDICIYVMTNLDIANAILKLHMRGVKIRIIIDADMAYSNGSFSRKLEKRKIPVRWMKSTHLMHHKFCLIDAFSDDPEVTPVVMAGSLNWTNQALNGNYEDVVVTSQKELVQSYKLEYERLWTLFKPIVP